MKKKKNILKIGLVIIGLIFLTVLVLRCFSDEDSWICDDGVWVKHGNPSSPMPEKGCLLRLQAKL